MYRQLSISNYRLELELQRVELLLRPLRTISMPSRQVDYKGNCAETLGRQDASDWKTKPGKRECSCESRRAHMAAG